MKIIRIRFGQYIHVDTVNLANFQIANLHFESEKQNKPCINLYIILNIE